MQAQIQLLKKNRGASGHCFSELEKPVLTVMKRRCELLFKLRSIFSFIDAGLSWNLSLCI